MIRKMVNLIGMALMLTATYANGTKEILAVVEENAGYLSFYNTNTGKEAGSIKLDFLPHEIVVTKDEKTAFVSNFGIRDYDSGSGIPGASIAVIDIPSQTEKYRLFTFSALEQRKYSQIDSAPHGVKLRPPSEKQLYVNVEKGSKVLVFDLETKSIVHKFNVSKNTHNIFFSPDGKILWLMAGAEGVIKLDADTGKVLGTYKSLTPVRGLKYTPDNQKLMVSAVNQISLIDPSSLEVKKQFLNLGVGSILYSDITPDQKYIIAPAAFDNQILIIEAQTGKIIKRLVTGLNPMNVIVDQSGQYAYISNATDRHITKLNLKTFELTNINSKDGPNGLAFLTSAEKNAHKTLTMAVALPLSGPDAVYGRDMMRGYEYWRLELEQSGGLFIDGQSYDVKLVYADTQSDPSNVTILTQALINKFKIDILLTTFGQIGYNFEKQTSIENHIPITPPITNQNTWQPNDVASGFDHFITSNFYEKKYFQQYNFKASAYSAIATSLGIFTEKSLQDAKTLEFEKITEAFDHNKYSIFYAY